jgi:hypothetical protein
VEAATSLAHRRDDQRQPPTTNDAGSSVESDEYALTAGPGGPVLLQDAYLIQKLAHFVRERVPDRVYHVKGGGAFGYFEVTADVTRWTEAAFRRALDPGARDPRLLVQGRRRPRSARRPRPGPRDAATLGGASLARRAPAGRGSA